MTKDGKIKEVLEIKRTSKSKTKTLLMFSTLRVFPQKTTTTTVNKKAYYRVIQQVPPEPEDPSSLGGLSQRTHRP